MTRAFLIPFLAHFALVACLYVWLTVERIGAVRRGEAKLIDYARVNGDRDRAGRVARNLSNQFEAPLFAYFAALFLLAQHQIQWFDVAAAWLFFGGRVMHTLVQTLSDNVRLRGQVFTVNFLGIVALMAHVAWLVLTGGLK